MPRHAPIGEEYCRNKVDNLETLCHFAKSNQESGDNQLEQAEKGKYLDFWQQEDWIGFVPIGFAGKSNGDFAQPGDGQQGNRREKHGSRACARLCLIAIFLII